MLHEVGLVEPDKTFGNNGIGFVSEEHTDALSSTASPIEHDAQMAVEDIGFQNAMTYASQCEASFLTESAEGVVLAESIDVPLQNDILHTLSRANLWKAPARQKSHATKEVSAAGGLANVLKDTGCLLALKKPKAWRPAKERDCSSASTSPCTVYKEMCCNKVNKSSPPV